MWGSVSGRKPSRGKGPERGRSLVHPGNRGHARDLNVVVSVPHPPAVFHMPLCVELTPHERLQSDSVDISTLISGGWEGIEQRFGCFPSNAL